jgi:hypothetical protein
MFDIAKSFVAMGEQGFPEPVEAIGILRIILSSPDYTTMALDLLFYKHAIALTVQHEYDLLPQVLVKISEDYFRDDSPYLERVVAIEMLASISFAHASIALRELLKLEYVIPDTEEELFQYHLLKSSILTTLYMFPNAIRAAESAYALTSNSGERKVSALFSLVVAFSAVLDLETAEKRCQEILEICGIPRNVHYCASTKSSWMDVRLIQGIDTMIAIQRMKINFEGAKSIIAVAASYDIFQKSMYGSKDFQAVLCSLYDTIMDIILLDPDSALYPVYQVWREIAPNDVKVLRIETRSQASQAMKEFHDKVMTTTRKMNE